MAQLPVLTKDADAKAVRTALTDAARTLLELRAVPADKRGDTHEADVRDAVNFITDMDVIEKALAAGERNSIPEGRGAQGGRGFGADTDPQFEGRSLGRQVVEGESFENWSKNRRGTAYETEVRNLIGGYTAGAYDSGSDGWLPVGSPQLAVGSVQRRRMFLRDLMSVQGTGLKVVPYVRETSQTTNETGAAMTSEGSAMAEVTATFENYTAIIEKITAWLPITDEIATDAPTLRGYIDTRLAYMLDVREEVQVLTGSGTSPNVLGLDNASPQTQTVVASDFPACIGQAIGKVENYDGDANGVACNPLNYWVAVTTRHANALDNGFGGTAPSTRPADGNITFGLPAVRSRGVTSGYAYVGDWRLGGTIFDRQETTITVGDQHSDYFTRGLQVVKATKRIGVAWHNASLFVKAAVPTS